MKSEVASLSTDFSPSVSEEFELSSFEQSELDVISSFYGESYDSIDKLRERFKRVSGVMLDTTKNSHGFSLSVKALKSIEEHFNKTKNSRVLHRKFLDHKFKEIEKQVGKLTKIWYDDKDKVLRYKGVDDKRHPTIARSDSFNSVSATIAHGDKTCSSCSTPYRNLSTSNCSCTDAHPVSNKAMDIELSYVSFPAYPGATSQVDNFSGDIQTEISSFFAEDLESDEEKKGLQIQGITDPHIFSIDHDESGKSFTFDFKTDTLSFVEGDTTTVLFSAGTSGTDGGDIPDNPEYDSSDDEEDSLDGEESALNEVDEETINKIVSLSKNVKELRELLNEY